MKPKFTKILILLATILLFQNVNASAVLLECQGKNDTIQLEIQNSKFLANKVSLIRSQTQITFELDSLKDRLFIQGSEVVKNEYIWSSVVKRELQFTSKEVPADTLFVLFRNTKGHEKEELYVEYNLVERQSAGVVIFQKYDMNFNSYHMASIYSCTLSK